MVSVWPLEERSSPGGRETSAVPVPVTGETSVKPRLEWGDWLVVLAVGLEEGDAAGCVQGSGVRVLT